MIQSLAGWFWEGMASQMIQSLAGRLCLMASRMIQSLAGRLGGGLSDDSESGRTALSDDSCSERTGQHCGELIAKGE